MVTQIKLLNSNPVMRSIGFEGVQCKDQAGGWASRGKCAGTWGLGFSRPTAPKPWTLKPRGLGFKDWESSESWQLMFLGNFQAGGFLFSSHISLMPARRHLVIPRWEISIPSKAKEPEEATISEVHLDVVSGHTWRS